MGADDLSALEASLWEAADQLRANSELNVVEYTFPVLGLIFLRHATNRFDKVKKEIEAGLTVRRGQVRTITAHDFKGRSALYLPEEGAFFTPPSLVRLIVNVVEPEHGKVFDPACGSAGMLVQGDHFIESLDKDSGQVATFHGREKSETTMRLARMNVAVHGFEGWGSGTTPRRA